MILYVVFDHSKDLAEWFPTLAEAKAFQLKHPGSKLARQDYL